MMTWGQVRRQRGVEYESDAYVAADAACGQRAFVSLGYGFFVLSPRNILEWIEEGRRKGTCLLNSSNDG